MPNRRVFHNVSRFDVSKSTQTYNDCKLYVSGRLVLSGVGTIISVTDSEIKLQIVGGKSRIKFNDKMTKHYIDEIDFGKASAPGYTVDKGFSQGWKTSPRFNPSIGSSPTRASFWASRASGASCQSETRPTT